MAKLINADKLIQKLRSKKPIGEIGRVTLEECIAEINYAEPVEPERPKGKWESDGRDHIYCTACKQINVSKWKSAFCPSCGADMRGVSE